MIHGHRLMLPFVLDSSGCIVEDETSMSRCCRRSGFTDCLLVGMVSFWLVCSGTTVCPVGRMNVVDCNHVRQQ